MLGKLQFWHHRATPGARATTQTMTFEQMKRCCGGHGSSRLLGYTAAVYDGPATVDKLTKALHKLDKTKKRRSANSESHLETEFRAFAELMTPRIRQLVDENPNIGAEMNNYVNACSDLYFCPENSEKAIAAVNKLSDLIGDKNMAVALCFPFETWKAAYEQATQSHGMQHERNSDACHEV